MGGDAAKRVISICLGATALLAATPALAQPSQNWVGCENKDGTFSPDASIDGCTALIQSGKQSPQNIPVVFNNRGIAFRAKGELYRALADYTEAIKLDPKYDVAYHNRGRAYYFKREYDRAIADYDQALRINPRYRLAYVDRGLSYFAKRDPARAIADYSEAIKIDPTFAYAFNMRGMAHRVMATRAVRSRTIRHQARARS
jgi:tetratricopeptide (TPR) repeat protein